MDNPFYSKAIFSWKVPSFEGGDPDKFADRLKAAGFEAIYLKMANGAYVFKPSGLAYLTWGENVKQALIDALRARGIKVIGWQFNYGDNITGEANIAISQASRFNVDGWIFDIESKFEQNASAVANAYTLAGKFKTACPTIPTGFCSWALWRSPKTGAQWHNQRMASAFMELCDVGIPMMYWEGSTPVNALWMLNESLKQWQSVTNKPIVPAGRAYTGDGGEINATAALEFSKEVERRRLRGISWWVLDSAVKDPATWKALTELPGFTSVTHTVNLPIIITPPAELTDAEKLSRLWAAHPELHS